MVFIVDLKTGGFSKWVGRETKWFSLFALKPKFLEYVLKKDYLNKELSEMKDTVLGCDCDRPRCGSCDYAFTLITAIELSKVTEELPVF
jgi:hypothetical protein